MRPFTALLVLFVVLASATTVAAQQNSDNAKLDSTPSQGAWSATAVPDGAYVVGHAMTVARLDGAPRAEAPTGIDPAHARQLSSLEPDEERKSLLTRPFTFTVGGFFPYVDSGAKLNDRDAGTSGTEIDFESDLDLGDAEATFFADGRWRMTPHHRIEVGYFQLDRDGQASAEAEIRFGDLIVPLGIDVVSNLDLNLGRISYGYSFINDGEAEFGVMAGAHIADLDVGLALAGGGAAAAETGETTLPLPHIGFMGSYAFTPNLVAEARVVGFYLDVGSIRGYLLEADAKLTYLLSENFGLGVGMRYFRLDIDIDSSSYDGTVDLDFFGPTVFGVITF